MKGKNNFRNLNLWVIAGGLSVCAVTTAQASEVFVCALQDNAENWGGIGKFKQTAPKSENKRDGETKATKKDFVGYKCTSLERETYYLRFTGYSIAIAWQPQEGMILSFIGSRDGTRRNQEKAANFYGARVSASIGAGGLVMVAANHRGLMTAFGLNTGIGFDVSGIHMEFGKASSFSELREGNVKAVSASEKFGDDPLNMIRTGAYADISTTPEVAAKIEAARTERLDLSTTNVAPVMH